MNFIDYIFFPFVLLISLLYFIVPLKGRWIILLLASLFFYSTWGIEMLPFVFGATFVAWIVSFIIEKWNNKFEVEIKSDNSIDQKQKNILQNKVKKKCKYILWLGVACILGVLIYTKTQTVLMNISILESRISLISILGVSYYTMSLIGYMADVYWKKDTAEKNYFKLLLFTTYFPKILQGPISKHNNIREQLYKGNKFDYQRFCFGLQRMLWGYFKKLVIADRASIYINNVFSNYIAHHGSVILVAAILSAIQMYCDFSGCMDIALGTSELFGIKLEENFKRPFAAKSVPEFWTRWHVSLSTWFKDYVYMPVVISPKMIKISGKIKKVFGKKTAKHFMSIVPTVTVWTITGLWHGTGWNYIAWGIYWSVLFVLSMVLGPQIKKLNKILSIDTDSEWFNKFRQVRTMVLFVLCRIIVAPGSLTDSFGIVRKIFFNFGIWQLFDDTIFTLGLKQADFNVLIVALILLLVVSVKQEQGIKIREKISNLPLFLRWTVYLVGIFSVLLFGVYGPGYDANLFVYMNF